MRWRRLVLRAALVVAAFYLVIVVAVFALQRRILFPAPLTAKPVSMRGGMQLRIKTPDNGHDTHAYFARARGAERTVVLFHGNGEQLADTTWLAELLQARGANVLAVEYPGYAGAPGAPTEASIYAAAQAGLEYLVNDNQIPRDSIVLWGQSLGSGVATEMASRGFGRKLVLITPFTSIGDVAARSFPLLPAKLLVRDRFDSASKAPRIAMPTLIVHGTRDEVVPFELGEELSRLFPNAQLRRVEGGRHNDVFQDARVVEDAIDFALQ